MIYIETIDIRTAPSWPGVRGTRRLHREINALAEGARLLAGLQVSVIYLDSVGGHDSDKIRKLDQALQPGR